MTATPMIATSSAAGQPFSGVHHCWTVHRRARKFIVRVIEPATYAPTQHGEIFNAVLTELVSPSPSPVDPLSSIAPSMPADPFDLVTFPEAFVPADVLLSALHAFGEAAPSGCVHVGLRPTANQHQHLFFRADILSLVAQLKALPQGVADDLAAITEWAEAQSEEYPFNIACLFAMDVHGRLRICLHPKIVRSRFETHPLAEHSMAEGTHLALVTLHPADKLYFSVTLQPLICSDALALPTDRKTGTPIDAVNDHADCFSNTPPDHVDVVSIATCTPQTPIQLKDGADYRAWHEQFQDTFRRAAHDGRWARHHHAAFVLSNFLNHDGGAGGLSGAFLPVSGPIHQFPHETVFASGFGRPKKMEGGPPPGANRWSTPDEGDDLLKRWESRGYLAALSPFMRPDAAVRIFGFTLERLPRDNSRWDPPAGLTGLKVQIGLRQASGEIQFEQESLSDGL